MGLHDRTRGRHGLRFCGMVEEPPRPSPRLERSATSSHHQLNVAGESAAGARTIASTDAAPRERSRWCAMAHRAGQPEFRAIFPRPAVPVASAASVPAAPELQRERFAATAAASGCANGAGGGYSASLRPQRHRSACCQPGARHDPFGDAVAQPGKSGSAADVLKQLSKPSRQGEHGAVSMTSWLVAPQCT